MRSPRRFNKFLNPQTFRNTGNRRFPTFDRIEETPGETRHGRDPSIAMLRALGVGHINPLEPGGRALGVK